MTVCLTTSTPPAGPKATTKELEDALAQARTTDKMFSGGGRYEAEVYKKMKGEEFPNVKLTAAGQEYYNDIKD